ncbi:MAG TPA: CDGSH iron-sulfur domain-containing protein [Dehalococcoidia bacterium]|nr:CDGSH iron-sulfur domain-containing protein [Dehalococcoidia bacterium]
MADETRVVVRPNGPYIIEGPLTVVDIEGKEYKSDRPRIALCRCGGSGNKPFCDGSHQRNGFEAPSAAPGG